MTATQAAAIARHNLKCAASGDRSYERGTNIPARTVEAQKMRQGGGVHGAKEIQ